MGGDDGGGGGDEKNKNKAEVMRLKVFARVRPPFPGEYDKGGEPCMTFGNDERTIVHADRTYDFDEVFQGDCSQNVLFERIARPTIDNAFKGFAGTVFVYGQTGTGKTHTMSNYGRRGVEVDPKEYGIIPRAVDYLFDIIHKDSGGQYTVTMQYLQLYRDNLQDLLSPDSGYLKLADAPGGGTVIQGVTTSPEVHSTEEFFEVYDEADKNRVVAETMMNKHSSRGHSVLTVFIKRAATESTEGINGKLVFVDLAGYERIKKTMIKDEVRKHEAQAINLSLGALAACIAALTAKSSHIPFRNSRLTRVLYDSLAGNSVTSVIITLGPSSLHSAESANTLYFGYNAIQCKTSVKRDLGPVDWQKEALQWKKKAVALSSQLTEMEAENKILLARLAEAGLDGDDAVAAAAAAAASGDMDDHGSLEGSRKMPTSFRTGGGSMHRRHSGMSASSGVNERLLDEVKDANAKLDEENVMRRKAEQDAEEARADVEEKAWTLEQEKSKLVYCESMNEELREQNAALGAARDDLAARLAEAERKLEQILPDETFAPTTGDDTEEALARKDSGVVAKLEPQFIHYNPSKYEAWADLVRSEVERGTVRATEFDRAHWFVSVPDLSAFVADDRRNFEFFYRRKMAEDDRGRAARVSRLRVRGRPLCRSTLEVEVEGDVPLEKVQQVCWQSSKDGFNFEEIAGSRGSRTVHVHPDLVHAYVRVVVAHQGVKTCSALVFINIDQVLDEQMQHLVVQGGVQFPVGLTQLTTPTNNPFAPPPSAHPPPFPTRSTPGEQPLLPPPPPPRAPPLVAPFKPGYILCIDCLGGVQIKKGGGAEGEATPPPFSGRLEELRARCEPEEARVLWVDMGLSAGVFALEANTARDRDLLLLTLRLFQALRVPGVGGALLGEFADEWLSGEWLAADAARRRALAPRVRAVSRTGHWSALHGSPSRRAGGEATFFLRAEELTDTPLAPADAASGGAGGGAGGGGGGGAFDTTHPQHGPAGRSSSAAATTLEPDLDLAFTRSGRVSLDLTDTMGRRLGGGSALGSPLTTSDKKDLPLERQIMHTTSAAGISILQTCPTLAKIEQHRRKSRDRNNPHHAAQAAATSSAASTTAEAGKLNATSTFPAGVPSIPSGRRSLPGSIGGAAATSFAAAAAASAAAVAGSSSSSSTGSVSSVGAPRALRQPSEETEDRAGGGAASNEPWTPLGPSAVAVDLPSPLDATLRSSGDGGPPLSAAELCKKAEGYLEANEVLSSVGDSVESEEDHKTSRRRMAAAAAAAAAAATTTTSSMAGHSEVAAAAVAAAAPVPRQAASTLAAPPSQRGSASSPSRATRKQSIRVGAFFSQTAPTDKL